MIAKAWSWLVSLFVAGSTLLSPLSLRQPPDLTPQLTVKISLLPDLDFSNSRLVKTISQQINYLVFNPRTRRVYADKNSTVTIPPASFTKLLTAQVALDLLSPDALLTASAQSVDKEPTILGLKAGERLTVSELIRGAISTSGNDAATVLAEGVATSFQQEPRFFVDLLNQKAQLLKLSASHFANPEGYDDPAQYSTLTDLAKLVYNALENYPEITTAGNADRQDLQVTTTHGFYYLPNWNGLLGVYPGVTGLKTAYTQMSGHSTIVTANRQNISVVAIVTGADSIRERDLAAAALLDAAFMQERLAPVKIRATQVNQRYAQWAQLANQIRATLTPTPLASP